MNLTVKKEDKEYCDKLMQEIQETHGFKVTVTELFSHILLIYKDNKPDWVAIKERANQLWKEHFKTQAIAA